MQKTSRELVLDCVEFKGPSRVPRDLWVLPWATLLHPREVGDLLLAFPPDIAFVEPNYREQPITRGNPHRKGVYTDEWGVRFENLQDGIIGEVKQAMIGDWADAERLVRFPEELLTFDADGVNQFCDRTDRFVLCPGVVNPFERLQFLRGSEELFMDLADPPPGLISFMKRLRRFYCDLFSEWVSRTHIDGIFWADDWGSQTNLLISPAMWEDLFLPFYTDFIRIAHQAGKKAFMHSDGHIVRILPKLIDAGLDAINSQIFCMGVDALKPFAGKITFWGEMDRQYLLPRGTPEEVDAAVVSVAGSLWQNGGCIAQCEFGPAAKPENVWQVYTSWEKLPLPV